jgi:hypothetical protein
MKRKVMFLLTLLFIGIGLMTAQNRRVTGVVVSDEDGQPVVGASVLVKGTTVGTVTDYDGKFVLGSVPADAKALVVSYTEVSDLAFRQIPHMPEVPEASYCSQLLA